MLRDELRSVLAVFWSQPHPTRASWVTMVSEPLTEDGMLCIDLTGSSVEVHGNHTSTPTPLQGMDENNSCPGSEESGTD